MSVPAAMLPSAASVDWRRVLRTVFESRCLDELEETELVPAREVLYQFTARGHEVTQALLALQLTGARDGIAAYYRSRPLVLALGLELEEALASTMTRIGSMSDGRDIGVIFNLPNAAGPCVLPSSGGVGTQYTPAAGWAQAIRYHTRVLRDPHYEGSIAIAHGGDASTATNGFWSALNVATAQRLPMLFYIEDNGYGISVKTELQTPGGNIAANLAAYAELEVFDGDGGDPQAAPGLIAAAVGHVRSGAGPALLRLRVPRLAGHSGQDSQAYKTTDEIAAERARDPLARLRAHLVPKQLGESEWQALEAAARARVAEARARVAARPGPDPARVLRSVFSDLGAAGRPDPQLQGGLVGAGIEFAAGDGTARPAGARLNMVSAIRRTLEHELEINPRMLVFGEDVGRKGGVHAATTGLQGRFGSERVFDTSLSEEGIIGRAVGLALSGLLPVPEIQFRKYAEPATEQLNDCGSMRWRSANRYAAPMVVRMPGGFAKCGDPWHSQCNEAQFVHATGWRMAMPSNAEDAVGLLRSALRGNDPTIFFEHRAMLDAAWARRPYPGDDYVVPFGVARVLRPGTAAAVISWGAMVERCELAIAATGIDAELLDLRTLVPWDREQVLESVRRTRRCLIVHEDGEACGFGAEIAAVLAKEAFFDLDAPIERLAMPNIPSPHSLALLNAVLPSVEAIGARLAALVAA